MNNRNMIIGAVLSGAVIVGALIAVACSSRETPDKIDLSSTHTTAAQAPESTDAPAETVMAESTAEPEKETQAGNDAAGNISYTLSTYTADGISIQYPVISNMGDQAKEEKVNQLLKDNALSLLKAWDTDSGKTAVSVTCQVPSITRKRVSALYSGTASAQGAAHPVNLFYSNTVDLNSCRDLGFDDYADPYTMAGYVLSDDVQFEGLSGDRLSAVLQERKNMDLDYYREIFEQADFPFDAASTWPSSFSYEKQGEIYFSIPVSHALGDYAIVKFIPETK